MIYKYNTYINNKDEIKKILQENTDNGFINILLGTKKFISIIKNDDDIILITKTRRAFKRNFYFHLKKLNDDIIIEGVFKFNFFSKAFLFIFTFSILFNIILIMFLPSYINNKDDKIMFLLVLIGLLIIELLILLFKKFIGTKDIKLITIFLNDIFYNKKLGG